MQHPGTVFQLPASLSLAEHCVAVVSQALLQGQPDRLEVAARELQDAARQLSAVLQGEQGKAALDQACRHRLAALAHGMAMHREACVRRLAVVERSLHSVIPSTRPSTYAGAVGAYGRGGSWSGAFRAFS